MSAEYSRERWMQIRALHPVAVSLPPTEPKTVGVVTVHYRSLRSPHAQPDPLARARMQHYRRRPVNKQRPTNPINVENGPRQ